MTDDERLKFLKECRDANRFVNHIDDLRFLLDQIEILDKRIETLHGRGMVDGADCAAAWRNLAKIRGEELDELQVVALAAHDLRCIDDVDSIDWDHSPLWVALDALKGHKITP